MKTAYVTKYALTDGILPVEAIFNGRYLKFRMRPTAPTQCIGPSDYALTKSLAIGQAEKKRHKKIESLRKQIAKLERLNFAKEAASE